MSRSFFDFLGIAVVSLSVVCFTRWRLKREVLQRRKNKKMGSVNIGTIFGMDVGGTLTKIVYFERSSRSAVNRKDKDDSLPKLKRNCSIDHMNTPDHIAALDEMHKYMGETKAFASVDDSLNFYSSLLGGRMHFMSFETRRMDSVIEALSTRGVTQNIRTIGCTGGGAHKYAQAISDYLDITVEETDELECLIRGMHFAIMNIPGECYTYRSFGNADGMIAEKLEWVRDVKEVVRKISIPAYPNSQDLRNAKLELPSQFPYLIVNIGSGVSILKVSSTDKYERVSGTSLGGGTYWGLCRLFTRCSSFEEAMDLAETGDSKQIDMLVRDIYGGSYSNMNLDGDMVASSFGKLVMMDDPRAGLKEEDLALALLMMITNNIGQVAYLNAKLHGCKSIFFVGSFLRHNAVSCRRLAFAINFWSKSTMDALFLEHDGYFGAIGTFLQSAFGSEIDKILQMSRNDTSKEQPQASSVRPRSRSTDSIGLTQHPDTFPAGARSPISTVDKISSSMNSPGFRLRRMDQKVRGNIDLSTELSLEEDDDEDCEGDALRFVQEGVKKAGSGNNLTTLRCDNGTSAAPTRLGSADKK